MLVFSAALELVSSDDSVNTDESTCRSVSDRVDLVLRAQGGGGLSCRSVSDRVDLVLLAQGGGGLALPSNSIDMVESRSMPDTVDLVLLAEGEGGLGS